MTTLLVHDGSPMADVLASGLAVDTLDGCTADDETLHSRCQSSSQVLYLCSGWDAGTATRESHQVGVLIAALGGSGKRLVYVSDATAIGDTGDSFGNEDSPRSSRAPHGWRVECEQRLERAIANGIHTVVVRLALVHGRNAGPLFSRLAADTAATGRAVYVEDGTAKVSTVHVDDVVSLIRLALERAPEGARLVAASDEVVSWRDLAADLASRHGMMSVSISEQAATAAGLDGATMAISNVMRDQTAARRLGWQATGPNLMVATSLALPSVG